MGATKQPFLTCDMAERFRWIHGTKFFYGFELAVAALLVLASGLLARLEQERGQSDEPPMVVDFFELQVPEARLHASFALGSTPLASLTQIVVLQDG